MAVKASMSPSFARFTSAESAVAFERVVTRGTAVRGGSKIDSSWGPNPVDRCMVTPLRAEGWTTIIVARTALPQQESARSHLHHRKVPNVSPPPPPPQVVHVPGTRRALRADGSAEQATA